MTTSGESGLPSFLLFRCLGACKSLKRSKYILTFFEGRKAANSFTDLDTFFAAGVARQEVGWDSH
jgi:hypothetical protein